MVVLDTSALLRWALSPSQLSDRAATTIAAADRLIVSAISIWEIALKERRGRLAMPENTTGFLNGLRRTSGVEILPVSVDTLLTSVGLDWEHRDPADRIIVATAVELDCELITSDDRVFRYYSRAVW